MPNKVIVGIIGGTGLDQDSSLLTDKKMVDLAETPYGRASDKQAIFGRIEGVDVYIISRHGKNHNLSPSHVNYRANLWTLVRQLHCTHVLVTSACGSLKEHIEPGHVGILDQYIDRTCSFRNRSFYKVCHVEQRNPINATMQQFIFEACEEANVPCHEGLTCVTIEGPRFSTMAESRLHRSWGCDVVNMTSVPEVQLATELATMYACILLITDYDCWRDDGECVSSAGVLERMKDLSAKARKIIPGVVKRIAAFDWTDQMKERAKSLKESIMVE
jgi:5'-methylthioadenosine phosphorylase